MKSPQKLTSLVLTGGGARGAYQVGVIQALMEITHQAGIKKPFPIISGASAGAINATYLAAHAGNMRSASKKLAQMWGAIHSGSVYEVGLWSLLKIALRLLLEVSVGGLLKTRQSRSLLETTPLQKLLEKVIPFENIQEQVNKKNLHGIAIKAINYTSGISHTFFQGDKTIKPWARSNRQGQRSDITINHVMASTAIPILFPPIQIDDHFYGDGNLRNTTPLSPSIKLGAEKILVIGVRKSKAVIDTSPQVSPTIGRVLSVVLSAILLDNIDLDYERLTRINSTIEKLKDNSDLNLKTVDTLIIRPSEDLSKIAAEEAHHLPKTIRYLVKGIGSRKESADLISNILFEPSYTNRLMLLGYQDTMDIKDDILEFLNK